jgi:hypothetical protein
MKPNSGWAPGVDFAVENLTLPRGDDDRAGRGAKALAREATTQSVTRESWTGFILTLGVVLVHGAPLAVDGPFTTTGADTGTAPSEVARVSVIDQAHKGFGICRSPNSSHSA